MYKVYRTKLFDKKLNSFK